MAPDTPAASRTTTTTSTIPSVHPQAKGLQKLKWYCQMCQKQCRDENGFKCHTMSESHLRQMRVYSEDPTRIMEDFSREFEESYLEALHRLHGTKRVRANQVYQE